MNELLSRVVLGQEIRAWAIAMLIAAGAVILAILIRWITGLVLKVRLERINADPAPDAMDAATSASAPQLEFAAKLVRSFIFPGLIIGGMAIAVRALSLEPGVATAVNAVFVILFSLVVIRFLTTIINELFRRAAVTTETVDLTRIRPLRAITVFVIWIAGMLFLLDNLGFDVTAIVAGLGITGIAVALAAQAILGDLFGYFVILFDRPFQIGDFIISGDITGTIERIGVKTTKVRAMGGEQVVVSNSELTSGSLRNFKRLEQRLVIFKIGVTYDTSAEKLRAIPGLIEEVIRRETDVEFLRVHFSEYTDWSLSIEVLYRVLSPDFVVHMDIKQRVNLGIHEAFTENEIEFAFPTRTVQLTGGSA